MKFNCKIDGKRYSFNVSAAKPLKDILFDSLAGFQANYNCKGGSCGNCIVLLNGNPVLSCLVPACKLSDSEIVTFESFSKTRNFHDIEKAYQATGSNPCPQCYSAKTLLIESIINRMDKMQTTVIGLKSQKKNTFEVNREFITREISLNCCNCIDAGEVENIVRVAYQFRRRRHGTN